MLYSRPALRDVAVSEHIFENIKDNIVCPITDAMDVLVIDLVNERLKRLFRTAYDLETILPKLLDIFGHRLRRL